MYDKSNGNAELAMKVVNKIFEKTHREKKHPWLAHLDQKNTSTQGVGSGLV